jgi:hypothetical protein
MTRNYDCPPPYIEHSLPTEPRTILEYGAIASDAANAYRATIDQRMTFEATMSAGRRLAIATQALVTAIADAVATSDNRLS